MTKHILQRNRYRNLQSNFVDIKMIQEKEKNKLKKKLPPTKTFEEERTAIHTRWREKKKLDDKAERDYKGPLQI